MNFIKSFLFTFIILLFCFLISVGPPLLIGYIAGCFFGYPFDIVGSILAAFGMLAFSLTLLFRDLNLN